MLQWVETVRGGLEMTKRKPKGRQEPGTASLNRHGARQRPSKAANKRGTGGWRGEIAAADQ